MTIKATWDNIELTDKCVDNFWYKDVGLIINYYKETNWKPEEMVKKGLARVTQPTFINGAKYFIHTSTDLGYPFNGVHFTYDINTNRFNGPSGIWLSADSFGTKFTVELVSMGPAPEVPPQTNVNALGQYLKINSYDTQEIAGAALSRLKEQAVIVGRVFELNEVCQKYNIGSIGDPLMDVAIDYIKSHEDQKKIEKAARQFVLNSFEYQGPNYDISLMNKTFNELVDVLGIECKYDNPNPDSIKSLVPGRQHPRNKYDREILPGVHVDVYDVLAAFTTNSAAIDHAVKKLLAPGQRGVKDRVTDLNEAISSIQREIDRIGEWSVGEDDTNDNL